MPARYVYRLDDITPTMRWERFWEYVDLFKRHGVRPLLGVVPDNRDPNLDVAPENPSFWQILRELVADGAVDIAQHGYEHRYESNAFGILGERLGFAPLSEFAGLEYDVQLDKIKRGQAIFQEQGLSSDVWMAPSHSFDAATLRALRETGFRAVTDGIALYPYSEQGLIFVPQQLWAPKALPFGVWTICLHPNTSDERLFERVREHVSSSDAIIDFGTSLELVAGAPGKIANSFFEIAYAVHIWRHRLRRRKSRE